MWSAFREPLAPKDGSSVRVPAWSPHIRRPSRRARARPEAPTLLVRREEVISPSVTSVGCCSPMEASSDFRFPPAITRWTKEGGRSSLGSVGVPTPAETESTSSMCDASTVHVAVRAGPGTPGVRRAVLGTRVGQAGRTRRSRRQASSTLRGVFIIDTGATFPRPPNDDTSGFPPQPTTATLTHAATAKRATIGPYCRARNPRPRRSRPRRNVESSASSPRARSGTRRCAA
jgi:hypothetical protein